MKGLGEKDAERESGRSPRCGGREAWWAELVAFTEVFQVMGR